jgi:ribonuclease G
MNRLAITEITRNTKKYIAYISLDENRDFVDFELYPTEGAYLLNHIYIGRVDSVVSNISAAFVRISPEQTCFLPLSEIPFAIFTKKQSEKKAVCAGDELLVQVVKEAVKTKDPVVSAKLTLSGSYAVLTTGNTSLSVSKKLPEEVRTQQHQLLQDVCADHLKMGYGIVTRTNSAQVSETDLKEDVHGLVEKYHEMRKRSGHLAAYTNVYRPIPAYIRRLQAIRDFGDTADSDGKSAWVDTPERATGKTSCDGNYDGIYTDLEYVCHEIGDYLPYLAAKQLLHFYDDKQVSLGTLYNIDGNIDKLLSNRIWLKSGANIIIEQLETLTFIDVNSAKNIKNTKSAKSMKNRLTEQILSINREAAAEAARALRLRNISGMVIIDFINMDDKAAEESLIAYLKNELKKDVVPCQFIDITQLGLVEITRKKVNRSLKEIVG